MLRLVLLEIIEHAVLLLCYVKLLLASVDSAIPILSLTQRKLQPHVRILDMHGNLLIEYGELRGAFIPYDQIPDRLIQAFIATEDREFFTHNGLHIRGILRACLTNIMRGKISQGGSSITQQLAKDILTQHGIFHVNSRHIKRKLFELVLAYRLERIYSKQEILELYLNRIYFGRGAFGISAASVRFFNKTVSDLSIYESAKLAGMIQAPSRYAADVSKSANRTLQVLDRMVKLGFIPEYEQAIASAIPTVTTMTRMPLIQYFGHFVLDQVQPTESVTIHTTINKQWQEIAEQECIKIMQTWGKEQNFNRVGVIICDHTGAIRAMVGGTDFTQNQFNHATQAWRQTGSIFKIFTYLCAIEHGQQPSDKVIDQELQYDEWSPQNANKKFQGEMTFEEAFAKSINTVGITLFDTLSINTVIKTARRIGFNAPIAHNLSSALGSSESNLLSMLTPMLTIANNGKLTKTYCITRVKNHSQTIYEHHDYVLPTVIEPQHLIYMKQLLEACCRYGTARRTGFEAGIGGKTGTSQYSRDQWMLGYSNKLVCGVLISTDTEAQTKPGYSIHTQLWRNIVQRIHVALQAG